MAGLGPAIHVFLQMKDVDHRDSTLCVGPVMTGLGNLALGLPHHLDEAREEIMTVARSG
jgi:hypothetical protein